MKAFTPGFLRYLTLFYALLISNLLSVAQVSNKDEQDLNRKLYQTLKQLCTNDLKANYGMYPTRLYANWDNKDEFTGVEIGLQPTVKNFEQLYSKRKIYDLTLERFMKAAASRGIKKQDITRAMFEGRFNPFFRDVTIVYYSLVKYSDLSFNDLTEEEINDLLDEWELTSDVKTKIENRQLPKEVNMGSIIARRCDKKWNEEFGSIRDLTEVTTVIDNKVVNVTNYDLMLRLKLQTTGESELTQYRGLIKKDKNLRYKDVLNALSFDKELQNTFIESIESMIDNQCAYRYFYWGDKDIFSAFNLRRDYYTFLLTNDKMAQLILHKIYLRSQMDDSILKIEQLDKENSR